MKKRITSLVLAALMSVSFGAMSVSAEETLTEYPKSALSLSNKLDLPIETINAYTYKVGNIVIVDCSTFDKSANSETNIEPYNERGTSRPTKVWGWLYPYHGTFEIKQSVNTEYLFTGSDHYTVECYVANKNVTCPGHFVITLLNSSGREINTFSANERTTFLFDGLTPSTKYYFNISKTNDGLSATGDISIAIPSLD